MDIIEPMSSYNLHNPWRVLSQDLILYSIPFWNFLLNLLF